MATVMADKGKICPLHKKDMSEVCHTCPWWTNLRGNHPQTGQHIEEWSCAVSFLPVLLVENAQESRQTGAAVETFRNEMVKANDINLQILLTNTDAAQKMKLIGE